MEPRIKTELWKHQDMLAEMSMDVLLEDKFVYWYADCGVGKTLAALEVMRRMHTQFDATMTLVLTVKSAIESVWANDIDEHTEGFSVYPLVKGTSKPKSKLLLSIRDKALALDAKYLPSERQHIVVVVNYETAWRLPLEKVRWDMVVADESHRLSSHNSKQSLELAKKLADVPFKIDMTGTPWADNLSQVFGQFRFGKPIIYANANKHPGCQLFGHWDEFLEEYTHYYQRDNIKIIPSKNGYKNQEQLAAKIAPYILRVRKDDVLDLPPIHHIKRKFPLVAPLKKLYKDMEKEKTVRVKQLDGSEDVILSEYLITQAHRLHQLTRGWYVEWESNEINQVPMKYYPAIEALLGLLEEIGGAPTVIFTSYKEDVRMLKEAISKQFTTYPILELTGEKHQHMQFQKGGSNILIANLAAGSTGVRLHRAEYLIYYGLSPSTSRTDYLQSIDRVHRPGQKNKVMVYHLIAEDTVDESAYELLEGKATEDEFLQNLVDSNG